MLWLETAGVLLLSLLGLGAGLWFSRLPRRWWMLGYFLPLVVIAAMGMAARWPYLEMVPPFAWLMAGRAEFALTALLVTMIFSTLLSRIPRRRERIALGIFMGLAVLTIALPPFAAPIFNRDYLRSLETQYDVDGVCRQSNDYTCGPAAAVTALKALGVRGEEGDIAISARTTRLTGTEPDVLAAALRERFGDEGIAATYRHFETVEELRGDFVTIARIKYNFMLDHYITVLRVTERDLLAADPMSGLQWLTHEEFAERWRKCGVVLERSGSVSEVQAQ